METPSEQEPLIDAITQEESEAEGPLVPTDDVVVPFEEEDTVESGGEET